MCGKAARRLGWGSGTQVLGQHQGAAPRDPPQKDQGGRRGGPGGSFRTNRSHEDRPGDDPTTLLAPGALAPCHPALPPIRQTPGLAGG